MRTKTLLLSVALGAASIAAVMAADPVYSVNIVGYVNKQLPAGNTIISNPLKNGDNKLGTILPTVPDGIIIYKWNNDKQKFQDSITSLEGLWYKATETDSDELAPGEGAFIQVDRDLYPNGITLTFVGEVTTGAISQVIPMKYSMQANPVPQAVDLLTVGYPAMDGDIIWLWDSSTQSYKNSRTFLEGSFYEGADVVSVIPEIGTGFFVFKDSETGSTAQTWTRTFNVN